MESITAAGLWAWILGGAIALDTIGRAVDRIVQARKAAKAPNDQQNKRLDDLEAWKAEVDRKLMNDNTHLINIDSDNRVTQRALLALLDHGIDGNNIKQMQHAKEELQEHLINR
jgi:hypothetical protein